MRHNWCTGSGKSGLRFDGSDASGTANGEMSFNVVWNNSGLSVKGNRQNITGNTIFDAADVDASKSSATFPSYQDGDSALDYCGPGCVGHQKLQLRAHRSVECDSLCLSDGRVAGTG